MRDCLVKLKIEWVRELLIDDFSIEVRTPEAKAKKGCVENRTTIY